MLVWRKATPACKEVNEPSYHTENPRDRSEGIFLTYSKHANGYEDVSVVGTRELLEYCLRIAFRLRAARSLNRSSLLWSHDGVQGLVRGDYGRTEPEVESFECKYRLKWIAQ